MGAVNFAVENASKTYAVLTSYEEIMYQCTNCEDVFFEDVKECFCGCTEFEQEETIRYADEFDVDCLKDNLRSELKDAFGNKYSKIDDYLHDRSYPTTLIAEIEFSKYYGDVELFYKLKVGFTSAYYDGASLDWFLYNKEGGDLEIHEVDDDIIAEFEYAVDTETTNKGLATIHSEYAETYFEDEIGNAVEKIEKIFEQYSTPLNRVGVMSNGVAIYEKA